MDMNSSFPAAQELGHGRNRAENRVFGPFLDMIDPATGSGGTRRAGRTGRTGGTKALEIRVSGRKRVLLALPGRPGRPGRSYWTNGRYGRDGCDGANKNAGVRIPPEPPA